MRSTLRLFYRIKNFNLMCSHQSSRTSKISYFRITYEFAISLRREIWEKLDKKDGCRRRDINGGVFINEKEKKSSTKKRQRSEKYFCCVTRCHSMYHSLSFVITRCTTLLSFYKRSFLNCFNTFKSLPKFCFLIHFRWVDVKSSRCFGGLSLISIILWEYCEKNIKTIWYYSYENKQIISQKVVR